jgi:hypothetical protein
VAATYDKKLQTPYDIVYYTPRNKIPKGILSIIGLILEHEGR